MATFFTSEDIQKIVEKALEDIDVSISTDVDLSKVVQNVISTREKPLYKMSVRELNEKGKSLGLDFKEIGKKRGGTIKKAEKIKMIQELTDDVQVTKNKPITSNIVWNDVYRVYTTIKEDYVFDDEGKVIGTLRNGKTFSLKDRDLKNIKYDFAVDDDGNLLKSKDIALILKKTRKDRQKIKIPESKPQRYRKKKESDDDEPSSPEPPKRRKKIKQKKEESDDDEPSSPEPPKRRKKREEKKVDDTSPELLRRKKTESDVSSEAEIPEDFTSPLQPVVDTIYQTEEEESEDEPSEGEETLIPTTEDVITDIENSIRKTIVPTIPITADEFESLLTTIHIKGVRSQKVSDLAKESGLTEAKTVEILSNLINLRSMYPEVDRKIRLAKSKTKKVRRKPRS